MTSAELQALLARRQPGHSLPREFYTDPALFELDQRWILEKFWRFVGHASQLANVGDYFLVSLGDESLIIIRGNDQQVHALLNVCRHRGSRVCLEQSGSAKKLVCPYHQWVYATDGSLLTVKEMPEDFDRSAYGLQRAAARVIEGLIFVCLDDHPPDIEPVARDYHTFLGPLRIAETRIACTKEYQLRANWKLCAENFRECYHCGPAHPEYCRLMIGAAAVADPRLESENRRRIEASADRWRQAGLGTGAEVTVQDSVWHLACRFPFREGYVSQSPDGQPVAPLLGSLADPDAGVFGGIVYPTFWCEACGDHMVLIRFTPLAADRTDVRMDWLVRQDAVEGRDYDLEQLTWFWTRTGEQDWTLVENNQAGVTSRRYQPGPYATIENDAEDFVRWYLQTIAVAADADSAD